MGAWCGALALWGAPRAAMADPWMSPGSAGMRHDVQLLADAGIIRSPITTWPISWPDVARDVLAATASGGQPELLQDALRRVSRAARAAAVPGFSGIGYGLGGAETPVLLRDFVDTPRQDAEAAVGAAWLGDRLSGAVRLSVVADPDDGQKIRLDGSYVGLTLGNFMISFGQMDRWWGPGWDGSLILSNNARPMPSVTVERNYTDASKLPVLRWLGPWRASLALGRAEGSDVAVPDVRFLAARVNFRPRPWLELGLSRTAQWCGEGRPCDFDTFVDLLIGRDNRDESLTIDDEPGNQMAGYDFRVRMPWTRWPTAVYGQFIGEDESGGLPSKFLGLFGAEVAGSSRYGTWRTRIEYADTTCVFTRSDPQFDCAYRNGLYPQGYAFRGRVIGHSLDGDGRMSTLAALLVRPSGTTFNASLKHSELNRDHALDLAHTVAPRGGELDSLDVQVDMPWRDGSFKVGVGYADYSGELARDSGLRGFVRYSRGL